MKQDTIILCVVAPILLVCLLVGAALTDNPVALGQVSYLALLWIIGLLGLVCERIASRTKGGAA